MTYTTWWGLSGGPAGDPSYKLRFSFAYNSVSLNFGPVYVAYTLLNFQTTVPNNLPGGGMAFKLGKRVSGTIGGDYSLRDKTPLLSASLTYNF